MNAPAQNDPRDEALRKQHDLDERLEKAAHMSRPPQNEVPEKPPGYPIKQERIASNRGHECNSWCEPHVAMHWQPYQMGDSKPATPPQNEVPPRQSRAPEGKYSYEGDWERLCVCGHRLATHTAQAPHTCNENGDCGCERFRPIPPPVPKKGVDEFVEELLLQAPALVTHQELASYKARATALLEQARREGRINELQALNNDRTGERTRDYVQDRLAELRKEATDV